LICDKIKGGCYGVFVEKNGGIRRNGGERDEGCLSGHKLNIIDRFTDEFKSINNSICKNDMSSYFLSFYHFFFSHCNSLSIYQENIFVSVYQLLLRWYIQLDKFTDIIFLSTCPFVFANFFVNVCGLQWMPNPFNYMNHFTNHPAVTSSF
jgi:hypothetical protein